MAGEWRSTTLGDLCDEGVISVQTGPFGSQLHSHDYVPSGVAVVPTEAIGHRLLRTELLPRITVEKAQGLARHWLRPGDILFARRGAQATGLSALITKEHGECICGTGAIRLRVEVDSIDPVFLSLAFSAEQCSQWLRGHAVGAVMPNLNETVIRGLPLILPPLPVQRTIAHILGTLDDKIELNRRMNETLEAMARALFKSWFVDFDPVRAKAEGRRPHGMDKATADLFPSEFEDSALGKVPKGWRVGRIRDCCLSTGNGGTPKRDVPAYWMPGTIPWLTSGEVRQSIITTTENFISEEGLANSSAKMWPSWATVVALYGATAGQTTLTAMDLCANQACCGLLPKKGWRFVNYLRLATSVDVLEQQTRGSAQQNLSKQIVEDVPTVIPTDGTVKHFDVCMSPFFDRWVANLGESRTLAGLRDALLPKLLSGEIRVAEAEKSVEEVA